MTEQKIEKIPLGKIGIIGFALFAPISVAFSQIFIGISLLGWILQMFQKRSILWKKTPLDYPILIYIGTQIIAVLVSKNIGVGLTAWLNTDWFIIFYYATVNQVDSEKDYKQILTCLAISGSISALYGIFQHFAGIDIIRNKNLIARGSFYRATGFFGLPLTYGGIQLGILTILFPFYFVKDAGIRKNILRVILIVLLASIVASYARSAWLGLGTVILLLFILLRNKYVLYSLAFIIFIFISVYFIHPDILFRNGVFSMFDISQNAPYNNLVRIKLWQSTWVMIKDHWLFGIGYSDWANIFADYMVPFDYRGLNEPHNDLLRVLALSGLLGGIAFIFLWFSDLKQKYVLIRSKFDQITFWTAGGWGSFLVVISFLAAGFAQEYYHDAEIAELWWSIVALGMISDMRNNSEKSNNKNSANI